MGNTHSLWQPKYSITPSIAKHLMDIEAARVMVENTPLPPAIQAELTRQAHIRATTLASVFSAAKDEAIRCAENGISTETEELRKLDHRARVVIALFIRQDTITAQDVAQELGLSDRMARVLLKNWVDARVAGCSQPIQANKKLFTVCRIQAFTWYRARIAFIEW